MEFSEFENIVRAEFAFASDAQMEQFRRMDALYRDWNSKINVISRKDIDGFMSTMCFILWGLRRICAETGRRFSLRCAG